MALYFVDHYGSETWVLTKGVAKTVDLAKEAGLNSFAVAVHTKGQLKRSIIFREAIGELAADELERGQTVIRGCTAYLLTERLDSPAFVRGPILAAHIGAKFLATVIKNRRATDIVYVPWTLEERDEFQVGYPAASIIS